jgi:cytochrome c biogenesis protein CcdA
MLGVAVSPPLVRAQNTDEVFVYVFAYTASTDSLTQYFGNRSDCTVHFFDLSNATHSKAFVTIVNLLTREGVEVLPPELCSSCELYHHTWDEILLTYASPLIGFSSNRRLMTITIAVTDIGTLDWAQTRKAEEGLAVRSISRTFDVTDGDGLTQLEQTLFSTSASGDMGADILQVLPLVVMAAAVDAVNPCAFYVLIVFLSLIALRQGKTTVLKAGVSYATALFVTYSLMGFGFLRVIGFVREARLFIVLFGVSIGIRAVMNFIFGLFGITLGLRDTLETVLPRKFKRVPDAFAAKMSSYLRKASDNPASAFLIGVAVSVLLLPCTSGPYLIALSLIADVKTAIEGVGLLTLYNFIMVTPFIGITVGIYWFNVKTAQLKQWSSTRQKWVNLLAGAVMLLLSLYLLFL